MIRLAARRRRVRSRSQARLAARAVNRWEFWFFIIFIVVSKVLSLSIEETNKLRAKLGLKPLNVNKADAEETAEEKKQPGVLIPGDRF